MLLNMCEIDCVKILYFFISILQRKLRYKYSASLHRLEIPRLSELLILQVMMHITYSMHCANI
jgi:hypothetical protein